MKNIIIALFATMLTLVLGNVSDASIARCKVEKVKGDEITLKCEQKAGEFIKGQWVKMKTEKKSK